MSRFSFHMTVVALLRFAICAQTVAIDDDEAFVRREKKSQRAAVGLRDQTASVRRAASQRKNSAQQMVSIESSGFVKSEEAGTCPQQSTTSMYASAGSTGWNGLDMPGSGRSVESSAADCQARCANTKSCGYFTFWPGDGGCHLQDDSAQLRGYGPGCGGCSSQYGPRVCPAPTPMIPTSAPTMPLPGIQCSCVATLYQNWAEGYPRDANDLRLPGNRNNCFGNAMVDSTTGFCATGNTETFTTLNENVATTGFSRALDVTGTNGSTDLAYHVSSVRVEGDSRCRVHAYSEFGCPEGSRYQSAATPTTQVPNATDRSYRPGVVTPGKNLRDVLGWANDQVRCIKLDCDQPAPTPAAIMLPTFAPTEPPTDPATPPPPPPSTPQPTAPPTTPQPTAPPTDYVNMTRVCTVYDCPFWCLDGCHVHDNKAYINSRASSLGEVQKTCSPAVTQLFNNFLCRAPETVACAYLAVHPEGSNLAKIEHAMKESQEYVNCPTCKTGCKK